MKALNQVKKPDQENVRQALASLLLGAVASFAGWVVSPPWHNVRLVLLVALGVIALLATFTMVLRREASSVIKLRKRLVSNYTEAMGHSPLAPVYTGEQGRA